MFPNDEKLKIFGNYSFSNCLLECYMGLTYNLTECIPWYLPRANDTVMITCDPWKTNEFLAKISMMDPSKCGHCLSDCDSVKYSVSSTSSKFE